MIILSVVLKMFIRGVSSRCIFSSSKYLFWESVISFFLQFRVFFLLIVHLFISTSPFIPPPSLLLPSTLFTLSALHCFSFSFPLFPLPKARHGFILSCGRLIVLSYASSIPSNCLWDLCICRGLFISNTLCEWSWV